MNRIPPAARGSFDWRWPAAIALYVVLTLLYFRPLLPQFSSALPSDLGDPALNAWILWWNTQALPLTAHWWNAPIFYPVHGALAFSETLLSMAAVSTPLMWAGATPVAAYNAAFMVAYPLTAIAAHALALRLTGRHDAALLAGLAFGFHPYRASQLPHIQLQWAMFMPVCLLALHRYLDRRRARDLVLAGACWALNGSALRVPARFSMLIALCLSQAAAIGFARLTPRGARRLVVAGIALVILAEGWVPSLPIAHAPVPMALVSAAPQVPVIELPARSLLDDTAAMLRAIGHRHPLVNGFSGFLPLSYNILMDGLQHGDGSVLDVVRGGKPLLVVINRENDSDGGSLNFVKGLPNAVLVADSAIGPVYLLSGPAPFGAPPSDPRLAIEHIAVGSNEGAARQMIDGDMRTRWDSARPRMAGDDTVVTLAGPSEITAVEMDLGDAFLDYPATMQVSVGGDGAPWQEVWDGNPRALLLHGALRDQIRTPIVVPTPPGTTGSQVLITCRVGDAFWHWPIGELRVWGYPVSSGAAPR